MKKEVKICMPYYKIAYSIAFVVILSAIQPVVYANEIGQAVERAVSLLAVVFCADTYLVEVQSKRSEVFCLYNLKKQAWAYKNVQIAWRDDEYFPVVGVLWKACTGQIEPRYTYMGWFCVAILILYGYMFFRKYYAMAVFGIISLLVPLTSHVMSTCRFTFGTYVVFVGMYDILSRFNKVVRWVITGILVIIEIYLLFLWYNSDCWLM